MARALAMMMGATGYLTAYFAATVVRLPIVWYFPVERRFSFEVHPAGQAMDFYGRVLMCVVVGAAGFGLGELLFRRAPPDTHARWAWRLVVWCASLLVLTGGLYVYTLWGRQGAPWPLPQGYVPR
jgi:hypothetical protein